MENYFQIILPIITLVIGYFLNVWIGSIESNREIKRRRIAIKEKAYADITWKLHDLFEEYRKNTLRKTTTIAETPIFGEPDDSIIPQKYDELEKLVYRYSLYLQPSIIQALVNLKLIDFREGIKHTAMKPNENKMEKIRYLEQHVDEMWKQAKIIISEMRDELGLEKYPDDLLNPWR